VTLATLHCAICGSDLETTSGTDREGVAWTRRRCDCGATNILHLDMGKLDLGELREGDVSSDFEIITEQT